MPCGVVCVRSRPIDAVVALELAGSVTVTALICLAEGFHRSTYFNVPVVCAVLVWLNGMIFARVFGRWL